MPANTRVRERVHLRQTLESRGGSPVPPSPLAPHPGPTNPGSGPGSGRAWRAAGERLYAAAATVLQNVDSCRTRTYYLYPRLSFLRNEGENLRNTNWTQSIDALTQLLQAAEVQLIWVCNRAIASTRSNSTRFHVEAICTIQRASQVTAQLPLDAVSKHFLVPLKPFEAVKAAKNENI